MFLFGLSAKQVLSYICAVLISERLLRCKGRALSMPRYLTLLLNSPLVIAVILVSGIGGSFQYGYNISVMTSPSAFIKNLMNRTSVQRYNVSLEQWQVSLIWSFTVSIYTIGGLSGSLISGPLFSKCSRKQCLLLNNLLAIFGAVLMILSQSAMSYEMIVVGRFLYGINAGVGLVIHPQYIVECSQKRLRAMMGVSIATFASLGKFCGQLLGIRELLGTEKNWPWLLGFNGLTALFQLLTLPFLPESPSFLLLDRGDHKACEKVLKRLWGDKDHSREVEKLLEEKATQQGVHSHSVLELIQDRTVRWQLLTLIVASTTVQLCGINAVCFYAVEMFRAAGIPEHMLSYAAMGTGLCELFSSLVCFMIIEHTGNKVLLLRGYMGMSAALILLTLTLYLQSHASWMSYCSMALLFTFTCIFSSGPAGVTAALPGQIFTQPFKSASYIVCGIINWTCLFTVGMLFPIIVENLDYFSFVIFLFFCIAFSIYVKFNVPETNNQSALEIAAEFERMHKKSVPSKKKRSTEQRLATLLNQTL